MTRGQMYSFIFVVLSTSIQVRSLDGVLSYRNPHFWTHAGSTIAGTVNIQLHPDANEQRITQQVSLKGCCLVSVEPN